MSLGQDLESMVGSFAHDSEDTLNELYRHLFMEEIAHAVHEDGPGSSPAKGLFQSICPQSQIEPLFVWVPLNTTEAFCKPQGVTVFAAWRHLIAARNRVPSHFRPFDRRLVHDVTRQPVNGFDG
jgi:hypothetical protein